MSSDSKPRQRIDKWMWYARVVKTRTLASKLAQSGRVRLNRVKVSSASQPVVPGDVLTIALERRVLVLRVLFPGERRGPAPEAQGLYEDLSPPPPPKPASDPVAAESARKGRPTKRDRRQIDAMKSGER